MKRVAPEYQIIVTGSRHLVRFAVGESDPFIKASPFRKLTSLPYANLAQFEYVEFLNQTGFEHVHFGLANPATDRYSLAKHVSPKTYLKPSHDSSPASRYGFPTNIFVDVADNFWMLPESNLLRPRFRTHIVPMLPCLIERSGVFSAPLPGLLRPSRASGLRAACPSREKIIPSLTIQGFFWLNGP